MNIYRKARLQAIDDVLDERHNAGRLGERQACITSLHRFDEFFTVNLALAKAESEVLDRNVCARTYAVELCVEVDGFQTACAEVDVKFDGLDGRKRYIAEIEAEHIDKR